jgi:hypothetical protein
MRCAALMLTFCLTISGIIVGSGCGPTPPPKPAKAALTPSRLVGEVALVDEEKRFALINLESNLYVPSPGTKLQTKNATGETAQLKASPEQKRPFIAADIVDGDPVVGDEVFR